MYFRTESGTILDLTPPTEGHAAERHAADVASGRLVPIADEMVTTATSRHGGTVYVMRVTAQGSTVKPAAAAKPAPKE
jgi:hypothetical protein